MSIPLVLRLADPVVHEPGDGYNDKAILVSGFERAVYEAAELVTRHSDKYAEAFRHLCFVATETRGDSEASFRPLLAFFTRFPEVAPHVRILTLAGPLCPPHRPSIDSPYSRPVISERVIDDVFSRTTGVVDVTFAGLAFEKRNVARRRLSNDEQRGEGPAVSPSLFPAIPHPRAPSSLQVVRLTRMYCLNGASCLDILPMMPRSLHKVCLGDIYHEGYPLPFTGGGARMDNLEIVPTIPGVRDRPAFGFEVCDLPTGWYGRLTSLTVHAYDNDQAWELVPLLGSTREMLRVLKLSLKTREADNEFGFWGPHTPGILVAVTECGALEYLALEFHFAPPPCRLSDINEDDYFHIARDWIYAIAHKRGPLNNSLKSIGIRYTLGEQATNAFAEAALNKVVGCAADGWFHAARGLEAFSELRFFFQELVGDRPSWCFTPRLAEHVCNHLNSMRHVWSLEGGSVREENWVVDTSPTRHKVLLKVSNTPGGASENPFEQ